jgi:predicted ATP-grasp superfamily ATP-dependent carboligase
VLVTGGDHTAALAAVRALRAAGYLPWVAATGRGSYAGRSRAAAGVVMVPYSGAEPDAFLDQLGSAVKRLGIRVLIPGSEPDLIAIAGSGDVTLRALAGLPEPGVVQRIVDKAEVYRAAAAAGLKVPRTELIGREHLDEGSDWDFPMIAKPVRSARAIDSGALVRIDAQLVQSRDELRGLLDGSGPERWLLQARVEGRLAAVGGVARDGEVIATVHQRSLRVWPPGAGVSAFAETVPTDPALEAHVVRLIDVLSWSGIFQSQFICGQDGPQLIDLNPRVYGSLALATAAGVNLPATWADVVAGIPTRPATHRIGVRYRSDELEPRALVHLARNGHPLAAAGALVPRRHTTHSILAANDPAPVLASLAKLQRYAREAFGHRRGRSVPG